MVLTNKCQPDGHIERRKARIVARGFSQKPGMDFNETFAPVARLNSIRFLVAIAAHYKMHIHHCDVTIAFLNSPITEDIYMEVPEQLDNILQKLIDNEEEESHIKRKALNMLKELKSGDKVCKLRKVLYSLKQAGREWHTKFDKELRKYGALSSSADPCVYYKGQGEDIILILTYVDDIIIASKDLSKIQDFKDHQVLKIKDLGEIKYCLGIEFSRKNNSVILNQKRYIKDLITRFNMKDANPAKTPMEASLKLSKQENHPEALDIPYRELIGCLMYLAVSTRPDIAYAVSYLSQFNSYYGPEHWTAAKRVLRYLKETLEMSLIYRLSQESLKAMWILIGVTV